MEVQSDICHQCVLWYHWGWTEPLRHLKTVPWKNTDWSSQLQLFKKTGEVLHLHHLVVSWYDWKVLFMCCLIVQPSSAVISEEFAPSVSNQAECWLRIGCQWVQINTVCELLLRMHLLRLVLLSGCPWLLENLCCGVRIVSVELIQHSYFKSWRPKLLHCCCVHRNSDQRQLLHKAPIPTKASAVLTDSSSWSEASGSVTSLGCWTWSASAIFCVICVLLLPLCSSAYILRQRSLLKSVTGITWNCIAGLI